ncbi:sulfatase-like hydrolase/transferase [Zobellia laminariae]|uniref:sulfatase-like hydrolase/transferase n=1 Tax=Zobellia laminariae TaxID=248906 RepID=UPI0026F47587|nr:sulfatase-like hydrolase/transferase [Zobellia laminariae]WKX78367.1 sulfatase-like hydrolase/transferase [Zobellia laminariae]
MQRAGYKTAAIGKWGLQGSSKWSENGDSWPAHPNNRGFDYYYGYIRHRDGHEHYPVEGVYRGKKEVYENKNEVSKGLDKCYTGDLWTAVAKKWIVKQVKDKKESEPFFMYLAFDTPHAVLELATQAYPEGGGLNGGLQWVGKP